MIKTVACDRTLQRHTLLDISDTGRKRILDILLCEGPVKKLDVYKKILIPQLAGARIPGIVRRADGSSKFGDIPVGFSAPTCGPKGRTRLASFVRSEEIDHVTSPFELLSEEFDLPRNACMTALAYCRDQATATGLELGVWGSAALELYTGLPYTHDGSDLDLLIAAAPLEMLSVFLRQINGVEAHYGLRIDAEVTLINGYGVHLKELLGSSRSVLGKGRNDAVLLTREEALAGLPIDFCAAVSSGHARGKYG
jgi:phosphoribosyl-dephospho-CoA transferase